MGRDPSRFKLAGYSKRIRRKDRQAVNIVPVSAEVDDLELVGVALGSLGVETQDITEEFYSLV